MADEGGLQNLRAEKDEDSSAYRKWLLFKVGEVVLSIIAIGLIVDPFDSFSRIFTHQPHLKLSDVAMIYVTLAGFIIVNGISVLAFFLGDRMPKITALLFTGLGTIMHLIAGGLMFHNWKKLNGNYAYVYNNHTFGSKLYLDMLISSTAITFINGLLFAGDVFVTVKYY
ncbi:uncharacterized protein LOC106645383 [Copidosoma floridanum]|uniref:uncharacterized protein LOC106645383 n=1 Tax=Copidosoma floridanum TaxID=29053 RepID=UPI0006C9CE9C|nr:uncharacterized protein LOC106645383 [Copidosoma floridanum]